VNTIARLAIVMLAFLSATACAQTPIERAVKAFPEKFPYRAFDVKDALDRTVSFYLTDADARDDRPLILVLQGSGCASNFVMQGEQVAGSWHAFVRRANKARAQILLVDKPGVNLFDFPAKPGDTTSCSETFRREQTGERWLAALSGALKGVIAMRGRQPKSILVVGHSEGAVFAPRLSLLHREITHVASLASAPVSQLHDFFDMAFAGEGFIAQTSGSFSERVKRVIEAWRAVSADPDSATKQVFGHAHRYWADKFTPFPFEKLNRTTAKFFVAYGDRDENSAPRTMDMFAVELLTRKRDITWVRVPGADHGFAKKGEAAGSGMAQILERVVAWFYGDTVDETDVLWPTKAS
jgi:pimeloyl-ACP methyl ester carboxylesterase